jgi:hypothetical protein
LSELQLKDVTKYESQLSLPVVSDYTQDSSKYNLMIDPSGIDYIPGYGRETVNFTMSASFTSTSYMPITTDSHSLA